jgi:hypothetical protein
MVGDMSERDKGGLRALLDKQEIYEVMMRYCRGLDRFDTDLIMSTFHPDAVQNQGTGDVAVKDLPAILANPARKVLKAITHQICNVLIELDGDVAHSESYFFACHRLEHHGKDMDWIVSGRYVDRFERRGGEWRIAHRAAVYDWDRLDEVGVYPSDLNVVKSMAGGMRGRFDRSDYSYQALRR